MLVNGLVCLSILLVLLATVLVSRWRVRRAYEMRGRGADDGYDGVKAVKKSGRTKARRRAKVVAAVAEEDDEDDNRYHAYR